MKHKYYIALASVASLLTMPFSSTMADKYYYIYKNGWSSYNISMAQVDSVGFLPSNDGIESYGIDSSQYVDLGLPSGTLWATSNAGASKPTESGYAGQWGDRGNSDYCESKWELYGHGINTLISQGITYHNGNLMPYFDQANYAKGSKWRTPTQREMKELLDGCVMRWDTIDKVPGARFVSKTNNNSLFIPAAGYFLGSSREYNKERQLTYGYYWTGSVVKNSVKSYALVFSKGDGAKIVEHSRYEGYYTRPVVNLSKYDVCFYKDGEIIHREKSLNVDSIVTKYFSEKENDYADLGLPSGTLWAKKNLNAKSEYDFGSFHAWGDTAIRNNFNESKWNDMTKYKLKDSLVVDEFYRLNPKYDIVTNIMGEDWRMPTEFEFSELIANCDVKSDKVKGVRGYTFVSKINGDSIFLPDAKYVAGDKYTTYLANVAYLTSTVDYAPRVVTTSYAQGTGKPLSINGGYFSFGYPIRPVRNREPYVTFKFGKTEMELHTNDVFGDLGCEVFPANQLNLTSLKWTTSDDKVATAGNGKVFPKGPGTCVITASFNGQEVSCEVTVLEDNDDFVDLGLPSGVKWSIKDLGKATKGDRGIKFTFGETDTTSMYNYKNYPWNTLQDSLKEAGVLDENCELASEYDAATLLLGDGIKTPSYENFSELFKYCVAYKYGGLVLISKINGRSISFSSDKNYWMASCSPYYDDEIQCLKVYSDSHSTTSQRPYNSCYIRPVYVGK